MIHSFFLIFCSLVYKKVQDIVVETFENVHRVLLSRNANGDTMGTFSIRLGRRDGEGFY
jgi:hypothetical protein